MRMEQQKSARVFLLLAAVVSFANIVAIVNAQVSNANTFDSRQLLPPPPPLLPASLLDASSVESAALAANFFSQQPQPVAVRAPAKAANSQRASQASLVSRANAPVFSKLVPAFRLDEYHSLADIYAYIDSLGAQFPSRVRVFSLGTTHEGRPLKALEVTQNDSDSDFVWLDALTHAREWITGSTLLYITDALVANAVGIINSQPATTAGGMFERKNFIIVPVVNPDGYSYTWTHNRLWRKNRAPSATRAQNSKCLGADLNRNFDLAFGTVGASADACSQIYNGAHAFSELETRAIAELMWSLRERIKFYLTIHSFNQLWACPYAHTTTRTPSYKRHMRVLRSIQRAVFNTNGVSYDIGPLGESLYLGSGFGIDFAYDKCKIEHSYLVELRDKGERGFVLPAEQILPTARETLNGLRAGLDAALSGSSSNANINLSSARRVDTFALARRNSTLNALHSNVCCV